jgi:Arc/MetJ family transcription regulator
MRTTVALDDKLLSDAQEYTGIKEKSGLLNEALRVLIAMEAQKRLALLGGTQPNLKAPPRRRAKPV